MPKLFKVFFVILGIFIIIFVVYKTLILERQRNQISPGNPITEEKKILNSLTLEQKIGQLFIIGFEGKNLTSQLQDFIKTIHPGGVILLSRNLEEEGQLKELIGGLQRISLEDTALPLLVAADQEGGPISRISWLKEKTAESAIKDTVKAYQIGFDRGKELEELGINLNLAPVLDMAEPGDFIYDRCFQKDSNQTGELSKALVSGQKSAGIFTAIKHFPGYVGISFNPERTELPILNEIPEITQFKKAIEAGPEMVMTSNVVYAELDENLPFTLSQKGIQFLKNELKDGYLIISDDLSSPVLKKEFSLENTIIFAKQAGVDVLIVAGFDEPKDPLLAFNYLLEAAKNGRISEQMINQSVLRIITSKLKLLDIPN